MKNQLLTFFILIICFLCCKSSHNKYSQKTFSLIGSEIKSYESELTDYIDNNIFHLSGSLLTMDSLPIQKSIRIYNNSPLSRIETPNGHEYIEYALSNPIFNIMTDEMGKFNLYFVSEEEFKLVTGFGYINIKPIMGKKLDVIFYLDK